MYVLRSGVTGSRRFRRPEEVDHGEFRVYVRGIWKSDYNYTISERRNRGDLEPRHILHFFSALACRKGGGSITGQACGAATVSHNAKPIQAMSAGT